MAGVASLSPLRTELDNTLGDIVHRLEIFTENRSDSSPVQEAAQQLNQVLGIIRMIELGGAELLLQELLHLSEALANGEDSDENLESLGQGLLLFQRYIDFICTRRDELPELLLPLINTLRMRRGVSSLPESQFFFVRLDKPATVGEPLCSDPERTRMTTRRLRQMYQIGLLGLLTHKEPYAGMRLMQRSTRHLSELHRHLPFARFCRVVSACLEAFVDMELELSRPRSVLFSRVDRMLRKLQMPSDIEALDVPDAFIKEMLYLIAVSGSCGSLVEQVKDDFSMSALPFNDRSLKEARKAMTGPDSEVFISLAGALKEELGAVKDMLDLAERGASSTDLDYAGLVSSMSTLSKTLSMVGMHSAANTMQKQQRNVQIWQEQKDGASSESLREVAEAVLYVEAMITSMAEVSAPVNALENVKPEDSVLRTQLGEAALVVWDEAMAGLTLAKRAVNAYLESDFDKIHLENLPRILQSVRGGLQFAGEERGARLLQGCANFIRDKILLGDERPDDAVLEVFADVLSSMEYFIEAAAIDGPHRNQALDLAETSLRDLGFGQAAEALPEKTEEPA
ncbi:hypothetical protein [Parendozoicomonas haliclonae]|uniref:Scaffold protein FimL second domain-containing protein n=1 Tax=Parendozoicomonas haliclonae TaxID=1960125 RepID=A0A1X7AMG7_9GAMM|nr:hypothetical protein [Parendozoicomonas haliclonae]SMA49131.1 hypothetical protein EHSB41UT_03073 [Parendozoicomonas haliclonae]